MERRYICDRDTPIEKIATVVRRFPVGKAGTAERGTVYCGNRWDKKHPNLKSAWVRPQKELIVGWERVFGPIKNLGSMEFIRQVGSDTWTLFAKCDRMIASYAVADFPEEVVVRFMNGD